MERTGDPAVDAVIEAFAAKSTYWIETVGEFATADLRDPEVAEGKCYDLAYAFNEALAQAGIEAEVVETEYAERVWYLDAGRIPPYAHCVSFIRIEEVLYLIDWTAAQFGYSEFPMVQVYDGARWLRGRLVA